MDVVWGRLRCPGGLLLAIKGIAKGLAPLPEREAAHLGDAIAGPRTLLFSQPPQAAKDSIGKP